MGNAGGAARSECDPRARYFWQPARASEISTLMVAVYGVPVGLRHGRASCFRRTTYDATVTTCRAVLRSHLGFGSQDAVRVMRVVTHIHGGAPAGPFELDELGAHLRTGDWPVRLSERYGWHGQGRSESDGGNE